MTAALRHRAEPTNTLPAGGALRPAWRYPPQRRDRHILAGGQIGHQMITLEDKADMPAAKLRRAIAVGLPNSHPLMYTSP